MSRGFPLVPRLRETPPLAARSRERAARCLRAALGLAAAACVLAAAGPAAAQRQSGIQIALDGFHILVSKDVGGDRWAITYDGVVALGNVYPQAGGTPKFVWCESLGAGEGGDRFGCWGADTCAAGGPCGEDAWTFIAEVVLPASFFELPDDAAATAARRPPPPRSSRRLAG